MSSNTNGDSPKSSLPNESNATNESKVSSDPKGTFKPIGDFLKELREKKNISLSAIAEKTRSNLTILKELENNNLKNLPDKTYVRGFIKSYTKQIGADTTKALECLEETYGLYKGATSKIPLKGSGPLMAQPNSINHSRPVVNPAKRELLVEKKKEHGEKNAQTSSSSKEGKGEETSASVKFSMNYGPFITLLVLVLAYPMYHLYQIFKNAKNLNVQVAKSPYATASVAPTSTTTTTTTTTNPKTTKTVPENGTSLPLSQQNPSQNQNMSVDKNQNDQNDQKAQNSQNDQKPEEKNSENQAGQVVQGIQFQKITSPLYEIKTQAEENKDPNILPPEIKNSFRAGRQNVFIKAVDGDSWITYKKDDSTIKTYIIKKDQQLFLHGKEIRILLGNFKATKVFYNNNLIDTSPGPTGVKNLVFPPENVSKFQLPLFIHHKDGRIYTSDEFTEMSKSNP